jgi:hypothetical protein
MADRSSSEETDISAGCGSKKNLTSPGKGFSSGGAGRSWNWWIGMIFGVPIAGYISDKILDSRRKVLILATLNVYVHLGDNFDDRWADYQC